MGKLRIGGGVRVGSREGEREKEWEGGKKGG